MGTGAHFSQPFTLLRDVCCHSLVLVYNRFLSNLWGLLVLSLNGVRENCACWMKFIILGRTLPEDIGVCKILELIYDLFLFP